MQYPYYFTFDDRFVSEWYLIEPEEDQSEGITNNSDGLSDTASATQTSSESTVDVRRSGRKRKPNSTLDEYVTSKSARVQVNEDVSMAHLELHSNSIIKGEWNMTN